jgi:hypothetical protein
MASDPAADDFDLVADVPIEEVRATAKGFVLQGHGSDRTGYRVEMRLDWPVDARTRKVLSEILSQAEVRVMRWHSPRDRIVPR